MNQDRASIRWPAWLAILKISKVPFQIIWITPTVFGYLASARVASARHVTWFVVAVLGTMVLEGVNCIHNELVDQEEDRINQPNRSTLLESAGERTLWMIVGLGYSVCFLGLIPLYFCVSRAAAIVMLLGGLASPLYNWGPRLKRRPGFAQLAIGWAVFCSYTYGWVWNGPSFLEVPRIVWLLTYFFFITSFIKDLPDVRGDEQVNAPGVFSILNPAIRNAILAFIYFSPYVLLYCMIVLGLLPSQLEQLLFLMPIGIIILILGQYAQTQETTIVAYEGAFLYTHLFFLILFYLFSPGAPAFMLALALFSLRLVALYFGLGPRFVEPDFSWRNAFDTLIDNAVRDACARMQAWQ